MTFAAVFAAATIGCGFSLLQWVIKPRIAVASRDAVHYAGTAALFVGGAAIVIGTHLMANTFILFPGWGQRTLDLIAVGMGFGIQLVGCLAALLWGTTRMARTSTEATGPQRAAKTGTS
jgi:hypothetical protein